MAKLLTAQRHQPGTEESPLRQAQLKAERQEQLGLLLLLLTCDVVVLMPPAAFRVASDLDVALLQKLRRCEDAWQLLRTSAEEGGRGGGVGRDGGTERSIKTLSQGLVSRKPALLVLACQVM